jgi:hypothetical protein
VEVLTSSGDDEPFSWWPAQVLGVMTDRAVVVAYRGWGEDYNDIFEAQDCRLENKSEVLSKLRTVSISISDALREALMNGELHLDSDATTLPVEEGVVMHVTPGGKQLLLLGASLKMERAMREIVRNLTVRAAAEKLTKTTAYLKETSAQDFSKDDLLDFDSLSLLDFPREGKETNILQEGQNGDAGWDASVDEKAEEDAHSNWKGDGPPPPQKSRSIDVPVVPLRSRSEGQFIATSWSVSSMRDSYDNSLSCSSASTNSLASPALGSPDGRKTPKFTSDSWGWTQGFGRGQHERCSSRLSTAWAM